MSFQRTFPICQFSYKAGSVFSAKRRSALLLAAAFVAGAVINPASDLIARHIGVSAAFAQDTDRAETYKLLKLFGDAFALARSEYVDPVSDKKLIENALNGMLTSLDPHSAFLTSDEFRELDAEDKGQFNGIGMDVAVEGGNVRVVSLIDDAPAVRAGIKPGDIIIALNGNPVERLSATHMIDQMEGRPNTLVTLTIRRAGVDHALDFSIRRTVIRIKAVKQRLEPGRIGYIRLTEFSDPVNAALKHAIRSLKRRAGGKLNALVLDLRDNPGGLMDQAVAVARDFIRHGPIVSTRARNRDDSDWVAATGTDILGGAPIVVLINSGTASASEVVAGALQDHRRAVLVGARSFGKGSVQETIPLPGNTAMLLTTGRYYTPSGRSIQGRGIVPDVLVADSPNDEPHFDAEHEDELYHVITNSGGTPDGADRPRTDLPPMTKAIPGRPPKDFPEFDPARPETDFQLQQALVIARAMAAAAKAGAPD
jgi:carboxyl-terminal processing protease